MAHVLTRIAVYGAIWGMSVLLIAGFSVKGKEEVTETDASDALTVGGIVSTLIMALVLGLIYW